MTPKQVQDRLCALCYHVMCQVFRARIPADCFCGRKTEQIKALESLGCAGFQFDIRVLEFIEKAVKDAIADALLEASKFES